jgi:hypothetical protein
MDAFSNLLAELRSSSSWPMASL